MVTRIANLFDIVKKCFEFSFIVGVNQLHRKFVVIPLVSDRSVWNF